MSIAENIKALRAKHGLTQAEFGEIAGVSDKAVSSWENGLSEPRMAAIQRLAEHFGITRGSIVDEVPVYEVAAGAGRYNTGYPTDTYDGTLADGETISHVHGTSMEPTLQDGDLVVIRTQPFINYQRQIALVKIDGERDTLKRVEMREDGMALIPDNPDYPERFFTPEEVETLPVRVMGVVVRLIRNI